MSDFVRRVSSDLSTYLGGRLGMLHMELTERCDNDCIHCSINLPAGDAAAREREMSTEQVKSVLQQAADLGCLLVHLTGGEPLLRPDFEELYLFARRLGLKTAIFTNARNITTRLAGLWAHVPPLAPVEVSVYGMHAASYEAVSRIPGSFAQFRRGVDRLLEYRVPFVVKGALLPSLRAEIDEFEAWAGTIPGMVERPGYCMFFDLRGRRDDPEKNRLIESVRVDPEEGAAMLTRDRAQYFAEMKKFAARFMGPRGDQLFTCGAGRAVTIDAYGRAQPCMGMRAPGSVDVLSSSLSDAVAGFADLGAQRATNPEYLRRCARCGLYGLCEQCPAKSWAETGVLDTPVEYLCRVAHAQARFLGWLGKDDKAWEVEVLSNDDDRHGRDT